MFRTLARRCAPVVIAVGSMTLAIGTAPSGAASIPRAVSTHGITWPGVVDSVALAKHRFVYSWEGYPYTVTYTSKTKWTKGSPRSLKKGLHITVTGNLHGMTLAATKIVA
jgi:hypothetical protein